MASWVVIPCLKALFAEFDRIAPGRDKASDGSVGDLSHQQEVSDHNPDETGSVPIHDADKTNEVHAIDVDNNLNESDLTMEKVVQFLLGRCRSGKERRLRYMIYNRRIWSASSGWVQKTYTGASAHTEHAHFSASYDSSNEASTASWHLEDIPVSLTSADKSWLSSEIAKQVANVAGDVNRDYRIPGTEVPGDASKYQRNHDQIATDLWQALVATGKIGGGNALPPAGVLAQVITKLDQIKSAVVPSA